MEHKVNTVQACCWDLKGNFTIVLFCRYDEWIDADRIAGKATGPGGRHSGRSSYSKVCATGNYMYMYFVECKGFRVVGGNKGGTGTKGEGLGREKRILIAILHSLI